jgi:hypothetical protein
MKFERIVSIILCLMMAGLIITTIKIYSKIFEFNEKVKAQKCETVVVPAPENCPIAVQGKCLPLKQVTAINMNEIAGRSGMYEVQMVFMAGEEKPTLKVEKTK